MKMVSPHGARVASLTILLQLAISSLAGCGSADDSGDGTNAGGVNSDITPAYALTEGKNSVVSESNPQVVNGDVFEDYHFALRVRRPSSAWRFMGREKVHSMNADAFMGLFNPSLQGFAVMIGEPMEGITLEEYADLVLGNMPALDGIELKKVPVQVDGLPGIVVKQRTKVEALDITYRFQFVKRENFLYQLIGWSMSDRFAKVEADLASIGSSLTFMKDRQPQVPETADSQDGRGADWRISDNIYSNASFGFQLKPTKGFRLSGQIELTTMNTDAVAGIICSKPSFYQIYLVERVGNIDREAFTQHTISQNEQEMEADGQEAEISQVRIGDIDAQQRIYRNVDQGGAKFDFVQTYFYRDSLFFHIQSWWPSAEAGQSALRLPESYRHLQWLGDIERNELAAELAESDVNNSVGPQFCYRNGVFRDFEFGFTLKTPPGLWQSTTGDTLQQENPDARLNLFKPSEGVNLVLIPEMLDMPHAEYHAALRQGLEVAQDVPSHTEKQGDLDLLVSAFPMSIDGVDFSFRLVTAIRGRRCVQILLSTLHSNEEFLDPVLKDLAAGFEFPQTPPKMIESRGATTIDHRLGLQVTSPQDANFTRATPAQFAAVGSMYLLERPDGACVVLAICSPLGFDEDLAVDALAQSLKLNVDPDSRRESTSTLAGLPARQVAMSGKLGRDKAFIKCWMAKRAHTMYLMLVMGKEGSREHRNSDRFKRFLTVID